MSLSIGGNYSNPYGSYGTSGGGSNVKRVSGFDASKIQSIVIKSDDMKKYGINEEDFFKVDVDEDGTINASEFLGSGISITSIFNAFKSFAESIEGAYEPEGTQQSQGAKQVQENRNPYQNKNHFGTNPMNNNSLMRPSVANPSFLAKNINLLG